MENQKKNAFFIVEFDTLKQILFDRKKGDITFEFPSPSEHFGDSNIIDSSRMELLGFHYDHKAERLLVKIKTDMVNYDSPPMCVGSIKYQDDIECGGCEYWKPNHVNSNEGYCDLKCTPTYEGDICRNV